MAAYSSIREAAIDSGIGQLGALTTADSYVDCPELTPETRVFMSTFQVPSNVGDSQRAQASLRAYEEMTRKVLLLKRLSNLQCAPDEIKKADCSYKSIAAIEIVVVAAVVALIAFVIITTAPSLASILALIKATHGLVFIPAFFSIYGIGMALVHAKITWNLVERLQARFNALQEEFSDLGVKRKAMADEHGKGIQAICDYLDAEITRLNESDNSQDSIKHVEYQGIKREIEELKGWMATQELVELQS